MADLNLSLGFDVETASIRKVQADITRALRDTTPEIDILVDESAFNRIRQRLSEFGRLTFRDLSADPSAISDLQNILSENIAIQIRQVNPTRRALDNAKRAVQEALARVEVAGQVADARGAGAVAGAGALPKDVLESARQAGLETAGTLKELNDQLQKAGLGLVDALAQEELLSRQLTKEQTKAATENIASLRSIANIRQSLENGTANLVSALRQAENIRSIGNVREDSSGIIQRVNQEREKLINELRGSIVAEEALKRQEEVAAEASKAKARADRELANQLLSLQREAEKNTTSLKNLDRIERELISQDLPSLKSAIRQAEKIEGIGDTQTAGALGRQVNLVKEALVRRLRTEKQGEEAAEAALAALEAQRNVQRSINQEIRDRLSVSQRAAGISSKQLVASENVLKALESEAQTILAGEKETKDALGFLVDKIREGARRLTGRQSTAPEPARASNQPGGTVTFRGAGDIQNFANQLNPQQLAEFVDRLNGLTKAASGADRAIGRTAQQQQKLVRELRTGQSAANEFGKQVQIAARRLLAWAAPANLIFTTLGRLRQAVNEVIAIDREARRLIFFQNAGAIITKSTDAIRSFAGGVQFTAQQTTGLRALADAFDDTATNVTNLVKVSQSLRITNQAISQQFTSITNVAKSYGIALQSATQALVEVTRVGQQTAGEFRGGTSAFLNAALALSTVERAALSTGEAVRGLQAIQAQFFGGARGTVFRTFASEAEAAAAAAQLVNNAAGVLESTAAGSSASVSELIDATTRLGSAFTNLAGLNFDQTVAILGESFTATGATTGRLATALRQTATLISQNASAIEELTAGDIEIVDADGTVRGFEAILDVLERIRDSAGTLQATELSLLIADRRNVADIQALAQNVDGLRDAFERFGDPAERVSRVVAAQVALYRQVDVASVSLEARTQNLRTAFAELANSEGLRNFGGGFLSTVTSLVEGLDNLLGVVGNLGAAFGPLTAAIGGLIAGKIINSVREFGKGLLQQNQTLKSQQTILTGITTQLRKRENIGANIRALGEAGLLTAKQEERAQQAIAQELSLQAANKSQIQANAKAIEAEESKRVVDEKEINRLLIEQVTLTEQIEASTQRVRGATEAVALAAERAAAANRRARNQRAVQLGLVAIGAAATAAKAAGADLTGGILQDALLGGTAGAAIGPQGAIAGAIAGALTGGIARASRESLQEVERENAKAAEKGAAGVGALLNRINSTQGSLSRVRQQADAQAQEALGNQEKRLRSLRKEIADLGDVEKLVAKEAAGELEEFEKEVLVGIRAALGAEQALQSEAIRTTQERKNSADRIKEANRLIEENRRLEADVNSQRLTARELVAAQQTLEENRLRLKTDEFAILTEVKDAEREIAIAAQQRLVIARRLKEEFQDLSDELSLQKTLSQALSQLIADRQSGLEFKVRIDEETFNAAIREAEERIRRLRAARKDGGDEAEIQKQIQAEERKITEQRIARVSALIKLQQSVLDDATKATDRQIRVWESAANAVTKAFANVVGQQRTLAGIFSQIGQANAAIISRTAKATSDALESAGASIDQRLNAILTASERQLRNAREVFSRQQSTLGERLGTGADISGSVNRLIQAAANAVARSDEEVTNRRLRFGATEAARARQLSRDARAQFDLRVRETRREIEIRRNLLTEEIRILQERESAERELNNLRRSQQEDFGRLLIESPEKFQETLDSIGTASSFFRGISEINEQSLRTLQQRSQGLREQGPVGQDALRRVLSGIEAAVSTGRSDIISGIGNRQLQQIFSRVQIENIGDIADDLIRQDEEARSQTKLQREIDARQRALVGLAEFDATIQRNLVALAQSDAQAASDQRIAQLRKLEDLERAEDRTRLEFLRGLRAVIGVLSLNVDPRSIESGGSSFVRQLADVLSAVNPQLSVGGNTGFRDIAEQIQSDFSQFLISDTRENSDNREAREKLTATINESTNRLKENINNINGFSASVLGATSAIGAQTEATRVNISSKNNETTTQQAGARASELRDRLFSNQFSNRSRFISEELRDLRTRKDIGEQLNRAERNRLRELERGARRGFRNDAVGGRQLARSLVGGDDRTSRGIVSDFRQTLADNTQSQTDFIDGLRRLRGDRQSTRGIDVGAVQRFLTGAGFEGAARGISTRGQAANALERFIELSERLAQEQGEISRETRRRIVQVLGDELINGIRDVTNKTADEAVRGQQEINNRKKAKEEEQANAQIQALQSAAEKVASRTVVSEETIQAIKSAIVDGGQEAATVLKDTLDESIQRIDETDISVDVGDLRMQIDLRTPDALNAAGLGELLRQALLPVLGDSERLTDTVERLRMVVDELVKKGIIKPIVGGASP